MGARILPLTGWGHGLERILVSRCLSCLRLTYQIVTNRAAHSSTHLFSHGSGGEKPNIRVSARPCSLQRRRGRNPSSLRLASGGCWLFLASPGWQLRHTSFCFRRCPVFFPWVSVCPRFSLQGHQSLDSGPTLIQYDLILTNGPAKGPIFQVRSHSGVLGKMWIFSAGVGGGHPT